MEGCSVTAALVCAGLSSGPGRLLKTDWSRATDGSHKMGWVGDAMRPSSADHLPSTRGCDVHRLEVDQEESVELDDPHQQSQVDKYSSTRDGAFQIKHQQLQADWALSALCVPGSTYSPIPIIASVKEVPQCVREQVDVPWHMAIRLTPGAGWGNTAQWAAALLRCPLRCLFVQTDPVASGS